MQLKIQGISFGHIFSSKENFDAYLIPGEKLLKMKFDFFSNVKFTMLFNADTGDFICVEKGERHVMARFLRDTYKIYLQELAKLYLSHNVEKYKLSKHEWHVFPNKIFPVRGVFKILKPKENGDVYWINRLIDTKMVIEGDSCVNYINGKQQYIFAYNSGKLRTISRESTINRRNLDTSEEEKRKFKVRLSAEYGTEFLSSLSYADMMVGDFLMHDVLKDKDGYYAGLIAFVNRFNLYDPM